MELEKAFRLAVILAWGDLLSVASYALCGWNTSRNRMHPWTI